MATSDAGLSSLALTTYSTNTYYSTYFPATGSYLTGSNAIFNVSSTTVVWNFECWVYPVAGTGTFFAIGAGTTFSNSIAINYGLTVASKFTLLQGNGSSNPVSLSTTNTYALGNWYHIAVSRTSAGVIRIFVNGVQDATVTYNTAALSTGTTFVINGLNDNGGLGNNGGNFYLSNLRFMVGAATPLYTANFNAPNIQLTAIANTSLLACNTINFKTDGSVNNLTITSAGSTTYRQFTPVLQANASVTLSPTFSTGTTSYTFNAPSNIVAISLTPTANDATYTSIKFNNNVSLVSGQANIASSTPSFTSGYSGNFVSGSLQYANNASVNTTGYAFTIEFWLYPTSYTARQTLFAKRVASTTTTSYQGYLTVTSGYIGFYNGAADYGSTYAPPLNQWSHIAYTHDGNNNITIYVRGSRVYGVNVSLGADNAGPLQIGGPIGYTEWVVGNISNFRMIKGYQIYTGDFAVPTSPLGLTQSASTNIRAITGAPTNGYSGYFNGTSANLAISSAPSALNIGTNSFTVECWIYTVSATQQTIFNICDTGSLGYGAVRVQVLAAGTVQWLMGPGGSWSYSPTAGSITYGFWNHIAIVRDSASSVYTFINGTQVGSTTTVSTSLTSGGTTYIGTNAGVAYYFNGWISNLRFVNGVGLYTTSRFIPSSAPLTAVANTVLLSLQNSLTNDASTNNLTLTNTNVTLSTVFSPLNTAVTAIQPNSNSVSLPGSTEINFGSNAGFAFGSNPYTVEFWVYPNIATSTYGSTNGPILVFNDTTGGWGIWDQNANGVGNGIVISARAGLNILGSATSLTVGSWNHVVAVRAGLFSNQTSIFLNGTRIANGTDRTNWTITGPLKIGGISTAGYYLNGYMSNVRVVNGYAVYDPSQTTLNVPKSPLVAITNTQLLALQTNITSDVSTNNITATTSGTPALSTTVSPFIIYGSGSNQFLSTALAYQQVSSAYNPALSLGQGHNNFTAEAWVYLNTQAPSAGQGWWIIQKGTGSTPGFEWSLSIASNNIIFNSYQGIPALSSGANGTFGIGTSPVGQWLHIALTKVGTSVNIWYNGNYLGTVNGVNNLLYTAHVASYITIANSQTGSTGAFNGYISNARVVYGKALYTVNYDVGFTPSTTPYTPTQSATSSVASIDNASSYIVNNGSSVYFNNTNDFLTFTEPASNFYSGLFNGSSYFDVIGTPVPLTGQFTIEAWVYTTVSATQIIYGQYTSADANRWTFNIDNNTGYKLSFAHGTVATVSAATVVPLNQWNHVAVSRDSNNTLRLFLNGVVDGSQTSYTASLQQTGARIGFFNNSPSVYFNGYMSNMRVVNGAAIYTGAFTPSATPLTRTSQGATASQVSFLALQNNTLKDNSTNAFAITNTGVTIAQKHPFTAYGDGSDVTVEAWVLLGVAPTTRGWIINNSATTTGYFGVAIETARTITVWSDSNVTAVLTSSTVIPLYTWTHIAVTLVNNLLVIYINGVRDLNTVAKTTVWQAATLGTVYIGRQASAAAQYFPGYLTNLRLVYGTAVYTARFTVPTSPLTATLNTVFLGLQSSVTFDASTNNATITKGSGATGLILAPLTSPFSTYIPTVTNGYSLAFNWLTAAGNDDYLTVATGYVTSTQLPGDFTIESWIYMAVMPSSAAVILDTRTAIADAGYNFQVTSTGLFTFFTSNAQLITGTTVIAPNAWYHLAVTRQNGVLKLWINGIQETTTVASTSDFGVRTQSTIRIGASINPQYFSGYISNTRLIIGSAIYTGRFTPSITPYSLTSITSTNTLAVTGITTYPAVGNPNGTNYSGSFYFGGGSASGSIISIPNANNVGRFELATYDFTIEAWFYSTAAGGTQVILSAAANSSSDFAWRLYLGKAAIGSQGTLNFETYAGFSTTQFTNLSLTLTINSFQWYHVAVVRTVNIITIYLNGIAASTQIIPVSQQYFGQSTATTPSIGGQYSSASNYINLFYGYISNARVIKGYAVYTGNFNPSTSPLTNTQNVINNSNTITGTVTSLLALQNSTTTDASSNNLTLTATGSPTVSSTIIPYLPTTNGYSTYFDGNAYMTIPYNINLTPLSSDFTVETWIYLPSVTSLSTSSMDIISQFHGTGDTGAWVLYYRYDASRWEFAASTNSTAAELQRSYNTTVPVANQWFHIAGVKLGSTISCYVNGVKGTDGTIATVHNSTNPIYIGANTSATGKITGYLSNLRIVKGIAVYTGNFTVPTVALGSTQSSSTNIAALASNSTFYNSFNGSSQYLSIPNSVALQLGTTYTAEAWGYLTSYGTNSRLFSDGSSGVNNVDFYVTNGGNFGVAGSAATSSQTFPLNSWVHVALVVNSGALVVYINGVAATMTGTTTGYNNNVSVARLIGSTAGSFLWTGFISNVRFVKGVAVYTGNFAVPTGPLTPTQSSGTNISAITSETVLLTCQSSTIVDNSSSAATITNIAGVVPVSTLAVFTYTQLLMFQTTVPNFDASVAGNGFGSTITGTPTVSPANMAYSPFASSNGRSVFFTDSSQYIQAPSNNVFTFGTDDFTIEGWIYLATGTASGTLYDGRTGLTTVSAQIYIQSNIVNYAVEGVSVINSSTTTSSLSAATWYHIAVVRISNVTKLYINGTQSGSNYIDTNNYVIGAPYIGTGYNSSNPLNGYISNLRVVDGSGVYSNNFVVPIIALTSTQSSSSTIIALNNSIPSLGNSVYFNGANDYMKVPGMVTDMGAGDFTIETYYYPTSFAAVTTLFGQYTAATTALGYWNMQVTTAGIITVYYNGSTNFAASTAILINEWAHIVLVRVGSTITLYVNGVSYGTVSYSGIFGLTNTASPLHIGATQLSGPTQYALGYMSNLRVVKGLGVYTGAFTVPTSPLGSTQSSGTNIAAVTGTITSLLLYQNSPFTDNSTYADTVTPFGSPQYSPVFSPSFFTYPTPANANSGYFNGSTSFLSLAQPANAGTGDFTIELWVYPTALGTASQIISTEGTSTLGNFHIGLSTTGLVNFYVDQASSPNITSAAPSVAKTYTWTHIAIIRSSGVIGMYVNGYRQGTTVAKATQFGTGGTLNIGRYLPSGNAYFTGYITNVRFVYGTALYTGTYSTPPYTTPLTAVTNTTLLLLQTTLTKDNSTNNVTVTNTGVLLSTYTNPYTMMKLPVLLTGQNSRDVTSTTGFRDNSMYNATLTSGALANASHQPAVSPFGIAPTLLLAQSSRGRDSSINNYTISAAQNTAIMPYVTPFSSTSNAIAFNGSTQYITNPSTSANLYGSMGGDFTIEFFMMAGPQTASTGALILGRNIAYPSLTNNNYYIMCSHPGVGHAGPTSLQTIQIYSYSYSITNPVFIGATPVCDSKWHHIAIVRINNIVKIYIDGVLDTSPANSFTNTGIWDYSNYTIGSSNTDGTYTVANLAYNGMLSNLRIINRVGIYTGTFTPPTTNLTLSQTSRTNVVAYTATTLPSTTSNSVSIIGPNQYLYITYITTLNLGLNDYTIEFWHYLAGKVTTNPILFSNGDLNIPGAIAMYAGHSTGNPLKYQLNFNAQTVITTNVTMQSVSNVIYGRWTHIALVRRSGIVYLYINGVLDSSSTLGNYSIYSYQRGYWVLGADSSASNSIYGMISNFRVVSGLGVYTGNFTVPTSALTTTQSSSTNIAAISNSLITNGGAVAYPYGSGGQFMYGNLTLNATSTNITVECWVYLYTLPNSDTWSSNNVVTLYSTSQNTTATGIHFSIGTSTIFIVVTNTVYGGFSHNMAASTWYHLAYVINNGTVTFYINGVSVGSMLNIPPTFVTNTPAGIATSIGASNQPGNNSIGAFVGGYISNLRVLKSIALYTGNFTPSTVPLTNTQSAVTNVNAITGTSTALLALQNATTTDASTNNLTLVATGNPTLNTKVYPSFETTNARSAYFQTVSSVSGTSSITVPSSISIYNYNIGTFTLECWVYPINFGGTYQIIISNDATTGLTPFGINASGTIFYGYSPTSSYGQTGVTSTVVTFNAWNHLAFVRSYTASGGTITIYINGQSGYSASNTIAYAQGIMRIGAEQNGTTFPFTGYISNVRLVNGIALYTSNFTVPTSPLATTQSANVNGNPSAAIAVNAYAGYFNGSQYIFAPSNSYQFVFGNNNFTLECYFNTSASGNPVYLFDFRGSDSSPYPSVYVSSNVLYYFTLGATRIASSTLLSFTWYHCAVTRNNNITTLYLNGVAQGTYNDTNTYQLGTPSRPIIGTIYTGVGSNYFYGYISNVRIVNGSVVYTGAFTPPTTNLTSTQSSGTNINAISAPTTSNGYYNNYFTQSVGQYLSVPGSQFVFGTNPFTVECYVYTLSLASNQVFVDNWVNTTFVVGQWTLYSLATTGYVVFAYATSTVAQTIITTTIGIPIGRWTHVAAVRTNTSANGFKIYINGLLAQTATLSVSIGVNATSSIGILTSNKTSPMFGFISNVRLTNGVAVYTDIYSPQSSPLTVTQSSVSTTESSLLVARGGTTTADASTNAFTLTATGSPTLNILSPFAVTNGSSVSFNGSNQYLSANGISAVVFNTGDFTVEVYAYCTNSAAMNFIFSTLNGGNDTGFYIGFLTAGIFSYGGYVTNTSLDRATTSALFYTWTHIAYVRINGVESLYFNGVLVSTTTRLLNFTINSNNYIGYAAIGGYFGGYLTNLRIVKGLGVYTGNFTPSTTPLTITQSSGTNIQAITGVAPTYGSSVNFNGSSYLSTTGSSQLAFGTSQYTIEFWVYFNALSVQQCFYDLRGATTTNTASFMQILSNNTITYNVGTTVIITSSVTFSSPFWYHIAVVGTNQNTNGVTMYVNGINVGTGTDANTHSQFGLRIGQTGSGTSSFSGNISNFRILVGTALYTTNFAIPANPLTAITNTKILVLQNSTTTDASLVNYTLAATGTVTLSSTVSPFIYPTQLLSLQNATTNDASINTTILTASGAPTLTPLITPFAVVNGSSVYFTGSSQYLTVTSNSSLQFGTQDFTIEGWVYILNGNTGTLYDGRTTLTSTSPVIYINSSTVYYAVGNIVAITGITLSGATWHHIAVTRVSNNTSLYINGVQTGIIYQDNNVLNTLGTPAIGTGLSGANPLNGYITNLRIVKGFAVYTNNFIVPIVPLTATVGGNIAAITGTSVALLTCQSSTIVDNSTFAVTITNVGSTLAFPVINLFKVNNGVTQLLTLQNNTLVDNSYNGFTVGNSGPTTLVPANGLFNTGTTQLLALQTSLTNDFGYYGVTLTPAGYTQLSTASPFVAPNGSSVSFTGSGNYLSIASNNVFTTGTDDFTIEGWIYLTGVTTTGTLYDARTGSTTVSSQIYINSNVVYYAVAGSNVITGSAITAGLWYHIAVVRISNITKLYINGVISGNSYTDTNNYVIGAPFIGQGFNNTYPLNGYISNLRVVKGVGVYVYNFTPQTTPFTATQTSSASTKALTALPTTGYYSGFFDGSSAYLSVPNTNIGALSGNAWTIEGWVYFTKFSTGYSGNYYSAFFTTTTSSLTGFQIIFTGTVSSYTGVQLYSTSGTVNSSFTFSFQLGTWYHVAVTRNILGLFTVYINGTSIGSITNAGTWVDQATYYIGFNPVTSYAYYFPGFISNFRIVYGLGIYTSNFTPSTTTLTTTQSANTNGSPSSAIALSTNTGYYNLLYTGVTTQYLTVPGAGFVFGTDPFTIECWVYLNALPATVQVLLDNLSAAGSYVIGQWQLSLAATTGLINFYWANSVSALTTINTAANPVPLSSWTHIAITRTNDKTGIIIYVNGNSNGGQTYTISGGAATRFGAPTTSTIGIQNSTKTLPFNGYITNIRFTYGIPVYYTQATLTPPTSPLTNTQSGGGAITAISAPTTTNGYYATAYAGLTTQYLSVPGTPFVFGTSAFTVECWVYISSFANTPVIIDNYVTGPAGSYTVNQWQIQFLATGAITFVYAPSISTSTTLTSTILATLSTWTHIAAVRTNTSTNGFALYVNGVAGVTGTVSQSIGVNATSSIGIMTFSKTLPTTGFISNVRITNLAVYTGAFTPQTTPLTATQSSGTNIAAITGTSVALLTCQSSTIVDNSTFATTITNTGVVEKVIAYGLFNNTTGVSLLTAQNATFIDNSVNAVTLANPGATPVTSVQLIGLFGTSITKLLALQTTLTGDASIYNNTITNASTNVLLEKTFSPMGGYVQPSLLAQQSGQFVDNSVNQINTAAPYYWAGTRTAYQTTMTPYGVQTPTVLLTAQNATLLSDSTGYHGGVNTGIIGASGTTVTNTFSGPFNNDTLLLTFQGSLITENSNLRPQLNIIGGGVAPTDSNPFTTSKSLTGLLVPHGYTDISISNSPIANNANIAQTVTVYNPFTIPSSLVSVLALQTTTINSESSIYNSTFTTSGTAPTSSTLSPFGTYNGNGILILNTAITTGITANIVNFANLLVTANDGVTTNSYSISVTALNTNNIGNRVTFDTGYNPPAPNVALYVDPNTSNVILSEPLYNTPITPNIGNIIITQWMTQDYRNSTLVANVQTGAANILVSEAFNSNLAEPVINTPIPLSGNIILTQWMSQDYRNSTLIANASTGGANLFVTSVGNIANISLVEPTSNVFLANVFSTPRVIVDVGTNPPSSSVVPTLYPTYAYTDGVFITAANVQGSTGGSSFASNQQVWY
jgi:hypothetical protein